MLRAVSQEEEDSCSSNTSSEVEVKPGDKEKTAFVTSHGLFQFRSSVKYLGHVVCKEGIKTDPDKIQCIADWLLPIDVRKLKCFLGLVSYYRRFIKNFAQIAAPLHPLSNSGTKWEWSNACNDAFFELKKQLMTSPVLIFPDFNLEFVLDTYASGDGIGAMLSQVVEGKEQVVAYASRVPSRMEQKYCATLREFVDCGVGCSSPSAVSEPEGQVVCWLEALAEFQYTINHRPGVVWSSYRKKWRKLAVGVCPQGYKYCLFGRSLFGYRGTTSCLKMACCVDSEKMSKFLRYHKACITQGISELVKFWRKLMPDSTGQVRGKILISGVMNLQSVTLGSRHQKEEHRWKCVLLKGRLKGWQWIFWAQTSLGHRYILVIGDYFTKWKEAFPLRDMEATSIARVLVNELICCFGVPDNIRTDQGKNFESKLVKEVCILLGVRKTRTTPYHPQSDERTLLEMLSKTVLERESDWDLLLPSLLLVYRTSAHETTGTTPFQLMFGRDPRLLEDQLQNIAKYLGNRIGRQCELLPVLIFDPAVHDKFTQETRIKWSS
eukprot:Em0022g395a